MSRPVLFFGVTDLLCKDGCTLEKKALKHLQAIQKNTGCLLVDISYERMFKQSWNSNKKCYDTCKLEVEKLDDQKEGETAWDKVQELVKEKGVEKWCAIFHFAISEDPKCLVYEKLDKRNLSKIESYLR